MKKKRTKITGLQIFSIVVLTIIVASIVVPFWNALVISFSTESSYIRKAFSWWPEEFTLESYEYMLRGGDKLLLYYWNTIKITVIGTILGMTVMIMAAYVFSRKFPGKKVFFMLMLFTMFFNGGLIPTYLLIKELGLLNKHAAIILLGLISVYYIVIMKNGFESVPMELQEAAMIDGANDLTIFTRIMLPLQKPLIATFSLFLAVDYWNSWYWPQLILTKGNNKVLQNYLRAIVLSGSESEKASSFFAGIAVFNEGTKMASVFLVILPVMVIYPFLQKYFVKGMLVGAVKT